MAKLKVMTVVGTRPEIIRLSRVIPKLDQFFEHTLVHTGQNFDYELNEIFFQELGIRKPDVFLNIAAGGFALTASNLFKEIDPVYEAYKPEALLILGDTNSALAAIPAKRRKIPIFHMEAGNRCFDQTVPEEINRKIVDHIADINLTYSTIAREYLLREGLPPDQIIKTGSPLNEVLKYYQPKIDRSEILKKLGLTSQEYFLISAHREENVDSLNHLQQLLSVFEDLAKRFNKPVIISTHPRTQKRLAELNINANPLIQFLKPFGFIDYVALQVNASCVLSDSGTITEESSILNFPAINLRNVNERPEGFEVGAVMMTGFSSKRIFQALEILESQARGETRSLEMVCDYETDCVSDKVVRIIQSYTDFVNRKVWKLH
jgi:UDP-N-acetylglucosamine 2-epimerase